MAWLRTIWSEGIGLFVDDGSLAAAIMAWLALAWLALPRLPLPPGWTPVVLFAGLAAILVESVTRQARKGR